MNEKNFNNGYIKVKQRILQLKAEGKWNDVRLRTEVVKLDTKPDVTGKPKQFAIVRAELIIDNNMFTAHAMETEGVGDVNYLHFIENAETSAIGRALSFAGISENEEVASEEDIENAKEQVKDVNVEKRKMVAAQLLEETLLKKQPTLDKPKVEKPTEVKFDESNIPVFKELPGTGNRLKPEREEILAWLKKVGKFDENVLIGAMIKAEISYKFKTFNDLLSKGSYNDLLTVFKHL
jgi:hypothetical protein